MKVVLDANVLVSAAIQTSGGLARRRFETGVMYTCDLLCDNGSMLGCEQ